MKLNSKIEMVHTGTGSLVLKWRYLVIIQH